MNPAKIIVSALLVFSATAPAIAQPADPIFHVVVVTAADPSDTGARLLRDLESDPELAAIVDRCAFFRFTPDDPLYRERYARTLGNACPMVALARSDGGVVFKSSGDRIPDAADLAKSFRFYAELDRELREVGTDWNDCPDGQCPPRRPEPEPWRVDPSDDVVVIPDTPARPAAATGTQSAAVVVAVCVAVFLLVVSLVAIAAAVMIPPRPRF